MPSHDYFLAIEAFVASYRVPALQESATTTLCSTDFWQKAKELADALARAPHNRRNFESDDLLQNLLTKPIRKKDSATSFQWLLNHYSGKPPTNPQVLTFLKVQLQRHVEKAGFRRRIKTNTLRISNLPSAFSWPDLEALFSTYGEVVTASVLPCGCGTVEMASAQCAAKAKHALNGCNIAGNKLIVKREERLRQAKSLNDHSVSPVDAEGGNDPIEDDELDHIRDDVLSVEDGTQFPQPEAAHNIRDGTFREHAACDARSLAQRASERGWSNSILALWLEVVTSSQVSQRKPKTTPPDQFEHAPRDKIVTIDWVEPFRKALQLSALIPDCTRDAAEQIGNAIRGWIREIGTAFVTEYMADHNIRDSHALLLCYLQELRNALIASEGPL